MIETEAKTLALTIFGWLLIRNGSELREVLDNMTVASREQVIDELTLILQHGGVPPNWVKP